MASKALVLVLAVLALVCAATQAKSLKCDLNGAWYQPDNQYSPGCTPGTGGSTGIPWSVVIHPPPATVLAHHALSSLAILAHAHALTHTLSIRT